MKKEYGKNVIIREVDDGYIMVNSSSGVILKTKNDPIELLNRGTDNELNLLNKASMFEEDNFIKSPIGEKLGQKASDKSFFGLRSHSRPLFAIWAITNNCNLRCPYCWPEVYKSKQIKDLEENQLLHIAQQIGKAGLIRINISGGEALLSPHIWKIIKILKSYKIDISVLSNGTTLTDENVQKLKEWNVRCAVSIDAPEEEINQKTRGSGMLVKALNGINKLVEAEIPTYIMVTVTKQNFPFLNDMLILGKKINVKGIAFQDLRYFGDEKQYSEMRLTKEQEIILPKVIADLEKQYPILLTATSELLMFKSQKKKPEKIMECPAGSHSFYIDALGNAYPCSTQVSSLIFADLTKDDLVDAWRNSKTLKDWRKLKDSSIKLVTDCFNCLRSEVCNRGCRIDALQTTENILGLPTRCPKQMGILENFDAT